MTQDRGVKQTGTGAVLGRRGLHQAALGGLLTAAGGVLSRPARAATYPDHPLRMIVPFAPGGSTDICARLTAAALGANLGQSVVVLNKAGGGTVIATQYVAEAKPDGYTMLYGSNTFALNPTLRNDLPYDSLKDLQPVGMVARQPYVFVINPSVPVTNVQEFVEYARAHPGAINYGTAGAGTGNHLAQELFSILSGTQLQHVPYQGDGPMVVDLLSGRIQMTISTIPSVYTHIQSGRLRALGVGDADPMPDLPGVPPISKAGVPGYVATAWNVLFVPGATPAPAVARLSQALREILAEPKVIAGLKQAGAIPDFMPPAETVAYIRNEIRKWAEVINTRHIVLQ